MDLLNKLANEGFLIKYDKLVNGIKVCDYKVNPEKVPASKQQGRKK